jgi:predicted small metal-binding protein
MRRRHRQTLQSILAKPTRSGISWDDVVSLLDACGFHISERSDSRVYTELNRMGLHVHRPHPEKEIRKGAVESIRRFFVEVGTVP